MNRKRFFITLIAGCLVLFMLEQIHRGAGRFVLSVGTMGYVLYGFWHYDKPWARRMLNRPKSWWMD